ncbi:DUF4271 domain-containing protein [Antarcticibacterium arcticum]|uniref:DUF4271 domain-containing protein n=1 Tax=Antarcticibacterium arcticum TaxID=2585771 RepID=A0A5B8YQN8_9FLAO|nr:DUF4271 domain-containing protein [Antarcticibacterium arcticum]QED38746.1 DUF4271 domain-containing protein [Antarcticibacterium arcticum]
MEALERYSTSNDLLTIIIVLILLLLVISRKLFQQRFEDFISLFSSGKYLVIKNREHKALFGFNVLMLLIHILSVSLFLFMLYRFFLNPRETETEVLFLRIFTAYSFFILLKITVEKIIANVFDIDETADNYLFIKHTYRNLISLILLPFTIFLIYAPHQSAWIIYSLVIGIFIGIIFALFRIIKKNQGLISRNWFYFILYLCALEITPYVILYKLITTR